MPIRTQLLGKFVCPLSVLISGKVWAWWTFNLELEREWLHFDFLPGLYWELSPITVASHQLCLRIWLGLVLYFQILFRGETVPSAFLLTSGPLSQNRHGNLHPAEAAHHVTLDNIKCDWGEWATHFSLEQSDSRKGRQSQRARYTPVGWAGRGLQSWVLGLLPFHYRSLIHSSCLGTARLRHLTLKGTENAPNSGQITVELGNCRKQIFTPQVLSSALHSQC
jgi:hypothetical protein